MFRLVPRRERKLGSAIQVEGEAFSPAPVSNLESGRLATTNLVPVLDTVWKEDQAAFIHVKLVITEAERHGPLRYIEDLVFGVVGMARPLVLVRLVLENRESPPLSPFSLFDDGLRALVVMKNHRPVAEKSGAVACLINVASMLGNCARQSGPDHCQLV